MRVYAFPARYATEVATVINSLRRQIAADEMISGADSPWPNGIIPKDDREGTVYLLVGELPADTEVSLFPMVEQPAPQRIAS
jgi:hypothetical protein